MATARRSSTTGILIVCFVATQLSGTLFARETQPSPSLEPSAESVVNGTSEPQGQDLPDTTAALSTGEQGASATALSPSATERFRVALNHEMFATDGRLSATRTPAFHSTLSLVPEDKDRDRDRDKEKEHSQRGGYRGRSGSRGGGNHGATTALVLGTIATVAGSALLVYSNRPACDSDHANSGCSYGTKVTGGAVALSGMLAILVGALTWR